MSNFEIKCPACGTLVTADDVMEERIREKEKLYKKKLDEENKVKLEKKDSDFKKLQKSLSEIQKTHKEEQDAVKKQARLDAEKETKEEVDKVKKNGDIERRRLQKKLEAMQKQIDQKSIEVQGEVQEELIEDYISEKFDQDELDTIKKFTNGADSILTIKSTIGKSIGKILIESKDTKEFQQQWIDKLLVDMKNKNADCGIIITRALPKTGFPKDQGFKAYEQNRIYVVEFKYEIVDLMLRLLRSIILLKETKKNTNIKNVPVQYKKLWERITDAKFATQFTLLYKMLAAINTSADKIDMKIRTEVANQKKYANEAIQIQKEIIIDLVTSIGAESLPTELIEFDGNENSLEYHVDIKQEEAQGERLDN